MSTQLEAHLTSPAKLPCFAIQVPAAAASSPTHLLPTPLSSPGHQGGHAAQFDDDGDDENCHCSGNISYRTTPGASTAGRLFEGVTVAFVRPSSTARIPIYKRLRGLGLRIIMVSREHRPAYDSGVDRWAICEPNDPAEVKAAVEAALTLDKAEGYVGELANMVTFDEYGLFPAAVLNEAAGRRPMPFSSDFIDLNNVKSRFRAWCRREGVRAPKSCSLRSRSDDAQAILEREGLCLPVVVKPCPGAGSSFVRMCRSDAELAEAIPMLWDGIDRMARNDVYFAGGLSEAPHLLVEEYIGGQEVDIDCVVEDGVLAFAGISDNFATTPPWFSEMGGIAPSQLPRRAQDALFELLESYLAAARRCGERCHGVLHFEAKYDFERDAAYVIEVNCRIGGAETETMVRTAFGVDLGEALMRLALGLPLQSMPRRYATTGIVAASVNVYPTEAGKFQRVEAPPTDGPGAEDLVAAVPFPTAVGTLIGPAPVSFGCFLWMVAKGRTASDALSNIHRYTQAARIVVEPQAEQCPDDGPPD